MVLNALLTRIEESFTNIPRAGMLVSSDVPFFHMLFVILFGIMMFHKHFERHCNSAVFNGKIKNEYLRRYRP